jgi:hypothetical protein
MLACTAVLAILPTVGFSQDTQQPSPSSPSPQNPQSDAPKQAPPPQTAPDQSSQNPPQAPPQNPPQKKEEGGNAAQAVGNMGAKLAQAGFTKVRDWEEGLIVGTYVAKNHTLVPLNGQQRAHLYLQDTLTTPAAYWKRMFEAVIDQARDAPPQWGGGFEGYGKRFASREAQFIIANSFAALGNARLGYEVRYEQCRCSNPLRRATHALARNFYTYNRSELEKRPQWALYGGAFGAGMISAAWKPNHNVLNQGLLGVAGQAAYGTLFNLFIEFSTDINRKLGSKK